MPQLITYTRIHCPSLSDTNQKGATLIEAMIAMFVLAFGVLVLMIAQLRSVNSVQEAENQTLVAQAAQTLMEGMLINPVLNKNVGSNEIERNYDAYVSYNIMSLTCATSAIDYANNTPINKTNLAQSQLCRFQYELRNKLPNVTDLTAYVCRGDPVTGNCVTGSNNYIIVASWKMQVNDTSTASDAIGIGADGLLSYRYILAVQE